MEATNERLFRLSTVPSIPPGSRNENGTSSAGRETDRSPENGGNPVESDHTDPSNSLSISKPEPTLSSVPGNDVGLSRPPQGYGENVRPRGNNTRQVSCSDGDPTKTCGTDMIQPEVLAHKPLSRTNISTSRFPRAVSPGSSPSIGNTPGNLNASGASQASSSPHTTRVCSGPGGSTTMSTLNSLAPVFTPAQAPHFNQTHPQVNHALQPYSMPLHQAPVSDPVPWSYTNGGVTHYWYPLPPPPGFSACPYSQHITSQQLRNVGSSKHNVHEGGHVFRTLPNVSVVVRSPRNFQANIRLLSPTGDGDYVSWQLGDHGLTVMVELDETKGKGRWR